MRSHHCRISRIHGCDGYSRNSVGTEKVQAKSKRLGGPNQTRTEYSSAKSSTAGSAIKTDLGLTTSVGESPTSTCWYQSRRLIEIFCVGGAAEVGCFVDISCDRTGV